ncbi:MAG: tetratricopeptide repeat protein [Kofleriaceae bacterium]
MPPSPAAHEAFERAIVSGNEFLRAGNLLEAQRTFLAALQVDPENVRALALLGLSYFRANQFTDARPIYEELCARLPTDASHRLNLGLVRLKLGDTEGAIEALEASRGLDPSQGRAVNYLGLAYARAGRYADAYEAFLIAGQGELAMEIEPNLADEERSRVLLKLGGAPAEPAPATAAPAGRRPAGPKERRTERNIGMGGVVRRPATASPSQRFVTQAPESHSGARPAPSPSEAVPKQAPDGGAITRAVASASPATSGREAGTKVSTGHSPPQPLSELATHALVRPDEGDHAFEVSPSGALVVRVTDRVYCRMSGVYAAGGALQRDPAYRRSRGTNSQDRFDHGGDPLSAISGQGYLVAFPEGGRFTAVYLDDDILYLREERVFAFSSTLRWENGHIPGLRGKVPVVQFRGDGAVAFRTVGALTSIKLPASGTMVVHARALAGWIGRVVPRAVMPGPQDPFVDVCVECTGEGVVLVESAAPPAPPLGPESHGGHGPPA